MNSRWCLDYLMEPGWDEGFTCSLSAGHPPPHRAEGGPAVQEVNVGTASDGRKYVWVYEWTYEADIVG